MAHKKEETQKKGCRVLNLNEARQVVRRKFACTQGCSAEVCVCVIGAHPFPCGVCGLCHGTIHGTYSREGEKNQGRHAQYGHRGLLDDADCYFNFLGHDDDKDNHDEKEKRQTVRTNAPQRLRVGGRLQHRRKTTDTHTHTKVRKLDIIHIREKERGRERESV